MEAQKPLKTNSRGFCYRYSNQSGRGRRERAGAGDVLEEQASSGRGTRAAGTRKKNARGTERDRIKNKPPECP